METSFLHQIDMESRRIVAEGVASAAAADKARLAQLAAAERKRFLAEWRAKASSSGGDLLSDENGWAVQRAAMEFQKVLSTLERHNDACT